MDNIQAQNLLSRNKSVFQYDEDMLQAIDMAIEALKERPHGKWVKSKDGYTRCDQCGSRGSAIKARFCHHCGADMR